MLQKSPINWLFLYFIFIMIFIMFITMNYFIFLYPPKKLHSEKSMSWKW